MKEWLLSVKPVTQDTHDRIIGGYKKNGQEVNVEKVRLSDKIGPRRIEKCQTFSSTALRRLKPQTCFIRSTSKHGL